MKIGQDLDSFGRFSPFITLAACCSTWRVGGKERRKKMQMLKVETMYHPHIKQVTDEKKLIVTHIITFEWYLERNYFP